MKEVAQRYAQALYSLSKSEEASHLVLSELRAVEERVIQDGEVWSFFSSPLVKNGEKGSCFKKSFRGPGP